MRKNRIQGRRCLALLLMLAMLISLFPVSAIAEDQADSQEAAAAEEELLSVGAEDVLASAGEEELRHEASEEAPALVAEEESTESESAQADETPEESFEPASQAPGLSESAASEPESLADPDKGEPAEDEPAEDEPAEDEPAEDEPAEEEQEPEQLPLPELRTLRIATPNGTLELTVPADSLQAKINDAPDGGTVYADDRDYTENVIFPMSKTVILDLGGHSLRPDTGEPGTANTVTVYGTAMIKNGTLDGSGTTDARGVLVASGGDFTLGAGGVISGYTVLNSGAGIHADGTGTVTLEDCAIRGNSAADSGGGIYIYDGSRLRVARASIANNHSDKNGGGLALYALTGSGGYGLEDLSLTENTAGLLGGGMYVGGIFNAELKNLVLTGNQSGGNGGGAYFGAETELRLSNATISGNTAMGEASITGDGTGLGGGMELVGTGSLTVTGGSLNGNRAGTSGGVIYAKSALTEARFEGVAISSNTAGGAGGALRLNGKVDSFLMSECSVSGNSSEGSGGVAYLGGTTTATITGGTYTGNDAAICGGVFYFSGTSTVNSLDACYSGNTSNYSGAALAVAGANSVLNMNGGEVRDNSSLSARNEHQWGAVAVFCGSFTGSAFQVTIDNVTFSNNYLYKGGGAAFGIKGGDGCVVKILNSTFDDNRVESMYNNHCHGGAIWIGYNNVSEALFDHCVFRRNQMGNCGGGAIGSGVSVSCWVGEGADWTVRDCLFEENRGTYGGGICLHHGVLTIEGDCVFNNNSGVDNGGGIYAACVNISENASLTLSENIGNGCTVDSALLSRTPGLFKMESGSKLLLNNNRMTKTKNGGGLFVGGEMIVPEGAVVEARENSAGNQGGGLWVGGKLSLEGSMRLFDNTSNYAGGGILAKEIEVTEFGELTAVGNHSNSFGGGVYLLEGYNSFLSGRVNISENSANKGGGGLGISVDKRSEDPFIVTIDSENVQIKDNQVINTDGVGGGINLGSWSTLRLFAGSVTGNSAAHGGGIGVRTDERNVDNLNISGGIVQDNRASKKGNDLYLPATWRGTEFYACPAKEMENAPDSAVWYDEVNLADLSGALAYQDGENAYTFLARDPVARIGATDYLTLQDAFSAIEDGSASGTDILLLKDTRENVTTGAVTALLDLDGHSVQALDHTTSVLVVSSNADLTLTDNSAEGSGTIRNSGQG